MHLRTATLERLFLAEGKRSSLHTYNTTRRIQNFAKHISGWRQKKVACGPLCLEDTYLRQALRVESTPPLMQRALHHSPGDRENEDCRITTASVDSKRGPAACGVHLGGGRLLLENGVWRDEAIPQKASVVAPAVLRCYSLSMLCGIARAWLQARPPSPQPRAMWTFGRTIFTDLLRPRPISVKHFGLVRVDDGSPSFSFCLLPIFSMPT